MERQNGAKLNDRDRNSESDDSGPISYLDRKVFHVIISIQS